MPEWNETITMTCLSAASATSGSLGQAPTDCRRPSNSGARPVDRVQTPAYTEDGAVQAHQQAGARPPPSSRAGGSSRPGPVKMSARQAMGLLHWLCGLEKLSLVADHFLCLGTREGLFADDGRSTRTRKRRRS
ncbi:uncharacterized protein A4U43_C01F5680 [Asparagus officinalis]|uniref:Uncharacterized protein n=1 Tax=Asparagus officinalis TaxID=4686 RepID=A0A5P1FRN1_ASPOF|nr:uncharacterized protein A4U43_C01F5680 [Asparagus officinalis]